jgi:integrase
MAGRIISYQKCPVCGKKYPSSKGEFPIICCKTQPTKFQIQLYWQDKPIKISRDREGNTIHSFHHARIVLDGIRAEIKTFDPATYHKQSGTSFRAFWQKFVSKYEKKPGTHAKVESVGRLHILPTFGDYQMRDIRAYHIDEWWDTIKKKELSPKYMNDIHQWLKRFFTMAASIDIVEKIPKFPAPESIPEPEVDEWLTEEEQLTVLQNLPEYDRPIFDFLFLTGCRVNEATALQRKDTDWRRNVTVIRHTIRRDKTLGPVKNKKKRVVPHFEELIDCLKALPNITPYRFINKWGRRYHAEYLRDTFRTACEKAGLEPIKLKNATRHSFGMGLLRRGHDIWQVSKVMNHSTIKMTEHYAGMLAEEMKGMYGRRNSSQNLAKRKNMASQISDFKR